ncbi:MAG: hypothetical protein A3F54_00625 [Candidatus Kerfeldbacteria bacterium RIFCSPHIGHO2_12_FULL_48_17]|uniref:SHS2 domain-containing protein n=1 Tax=Candidatus Kerfeldbacteria bacterium RIFCSPHIGHO2_12_FULL_48_17 TaxID=1798542 RepID=A0A1G2B5F6_9BACT|nr:MAG: hypothetical protein A3F54_00625 [Candidatus Kerfeldbacteria bacterium RIFCSPHIGHO2_12_FULL_48_17]
MGFFRKKQSYLGIDIGTSAIKLTELESERSRPKLVTYGFLEQETDLLHGDIEEQKQKILPALKKIYKASQAQSDKVVAALPSYAVFSSIIQLPVMSKKDLASAIRWEANKFVPIPLKEMVLDWKILDEEMVSTENTPVETFEDSGGAVDPTLQPHSLPTIVGKPTKNIKILITAAPKNLVNKYVEIFRTGGLQLVSLETESFALERSLIGHDKSAIMVIDIGASATNINVMMNSIPIISRSIDLGGNTITKTISNSLNIDHVRAEQFKRDIGLNTSKSGTAGTQIPSRIEFLINSIVNEIRYVMNMYQGQHDKDIEKVILAGGSSWLPNLTSFLSQTLNLRVFIGDPWARIVYPVELKPALNEIGPSYAVSVGLAMREIV